MVVDGKSHDRMNIRNPEVIDIKPKGLKNLEM